MGQLSQEVSDYLHEAETPEDFRYRKGFWDGHIKTITFLEVLISMAEVTDEEFIQAELGKMMEPFRSMALPKGESREQDERLSRVLQRASRKIPQD